jgi:hypothetical protein
MKIEKVRSKAVDDLVKSAQNCFDAAQIQAIGADKQHAIANAQHILADKQHAIADAQNVIADQQHASAEKMVALGEALEAGAEELNDETESVALRISPALEAVMTTTAPIRK